MEKNLIEAIKKIESLSKKKLELLYKLKISLMIRELWPDAIWPVHTYIGGSVISRQNRRALCGESNEGYRYHIRDSTREIRTFAIKDIPESLKQEPHIARALEYIKKH